MDKKLPPNEAKKLIDLLGIRLDKEICSIYEKIDDTMAQYMINVLHNQVIGAIPHSRLYMPWTASDKKLLVTYESVGKLIKEEGDKARDPDDPDKVKVKHEGDPGETGNCAAINCAAITRKRKPTAAPTTERESTRKMRRTKKPGPGITGQSEWRAEQAVKQLQHRISQMATDVTISEMDVELFYSSVLKRVFQGSNQRLLVDILHESFQHGGRFDGTSIWMKKAKLLSERLRVEEHDTEMADFVQIWGEMAFDGGIRSRSAPLFMLSRKVEVVRRFDGLMRPERQQQTMDLLERHGLHCRHGVSMRDCVAQFFSMELGLLNAEAFSDSLRAWRRVADMGECFGQGVLIFMKISVGETTKRLATLEQRASSGKRRLTALLDAACDMYPGLQLFCDLARTNVVEPILLQQTLPMTLTSELGCVE